MHKNNGFIIRAVRMCIILGRFAVSGPSCMTDPACASHTFPVICFFCKDLQTPLCLYYRDLIRLFITNRDSRRIIPSVLQL